MTVTYRIFGRKQIEVNTDPQRRCYWGVHAKSEWVWTHWYFLGTCFSEEDANVSVEVWKKCNRNNQYKWVKCESEESIDSVTERVNRNED